jgi:hypothetical protein
MTPNSWRHFEQSFFARGCEQLWAWYSISGLLLAAKNHVLELYKLLRK